MKARWIFGFGVLVSLSSVAYIGIAQGQTSVRTVLGQGQVVYGGFLRAWATTENNKVTKVGLTIPMATIRNSPDTVPNMGAAGQNMGPAVNMKPKAVLEFPQIVQDQTFFNHVDFWWEPTGHPPTYMVGHYDMHFFGIAPKTAASIDCSNPKQAEFPQYAKGYIPAVPPNENPKDFCVPLMGYHSIDPRDLELAPGMFERTMIHSFYNGQMNAFEPMITKKTFMKQAPFALPVGQFSSVERKTMYPTKFMAIFDGAKQEYRLEFSGFEMRE
jgi:hypothetical protein